MKTFYFYIQIILFSILLGACSVEKYIPEGEKLYTGATLDLQTSDTIKNLNRIETELETLLQPKPNTKILGIRLGLWSHYKAQKEKPGFLSKFLNKKLGEEPVYLSEIDISKTIELIDNRLKNRGFFENTITSEITRKDNKGNIKYNIDTKKPYRIETYQLDTLPSPIQEEIKKTMSNTLLEKGDRFDLALLKRERERIDILLKKKGYYNFNADFMIFEADTNQYASKRFDLFLRLKKDIPRKSIVPYTIHDIKVYPNYTGKFDQKKKDTVVINEIQFIQEGTFFKPKRLSPYILFEEGQLYNPEISKRTSKRLSSIGAYKFINVQFDALDSINDGITPKKLGAKIFLSPLAKRSLRLELQAVSKSNNFAGPTLQARYSNRNVFKGAETLNVTTTLGYETQIGGKNNQGLSSIQLGGGIDLIFPRLLSPIKINRPFKYAIPSTKIGVQAELLNRSQLYNLTSFSTTFGYEWNANRFVFHGLTPININYTNLSNTTPEFETILEENEFLRSSFDQQFIAGLTYTFIYNEINESSIKNQFFTKINFDIAGNLVDLIARNSSDNNQEPNTFLGLQYAQYAKIDADFRYYFSFGNEHKLVSRLFAGIGKPYGNSNTLPFIKQFFSGGPYSVRAFRIRSLGPGTYTPPNDDIGDFFDRAGDIRLEANLEYRFPLFPYVYGAIFADAGNVWLLDQNPDLPGGEFSSNFINELGIGSGIGIRVDIQNFVIRFDLAAPLLDPSETSKDFDFENPILNFAIGYPF
ncbi:translocation and assembly module lipoprotein TamL [Aquimarina algicola]|uniref:Bacterial surface antigen (D15) domain-containing protein n=1 Tax=Aquimarina algicola TaxID=2589995 RepID=A0A504J7A4_9FLAO|nr:BamA/TamA family outer membrane protein [Aquimarina algicola]TPN84485.1 hypothetical protein FHK87_16260 [Aquimarina algicola]